jgi:hypothetical protein
MWGRQLLGFDPGHSRPYNRSNTLNFREDLQCLSTSMNAAGVNTGLRRSNAFPIPRSSNARLAADPSHNCCPRPLSSSRVPAGTPLITRRRARGLLHRRGMASRMAAPVPLRASPPNPSLPRRHRVGSSGQCSVASRQWLATRRSRRSPLATIFCLS